MHKKRLCAIVWSGKLAVIQRRACGARDAGRGPGPRIGASGTFREL